MTDEQIIKALECCIVEDKCQGCPYSSVCLDDKYVSVVGKDALDLINRQRAEIEKLKEFKSKYVDEVAAMGVKAFAEKLCKDRVSNDPVVIAVRSELKKEME